MNELFKGHKLILFIFLLQMFSCSKNNNPNGAAALTIINAVVSSNRLVTNFSGTDSITYLTARQLPYGSYNAAINEFGNHSGLVKIGLFQYPDTSAHSSPLYNLSINLQPNSIHTLFLTGMVGAPDTLLTTDILPVHTDSAAGIRFVNLSSGSNPVNITLSTSTSTNEISGLAYKGISSFKNYPVIASVSSYTFQFRDAGTNIVLGSYTMNGINNGTGTNTSANQYRFRNVTIALIGAPGGSGANAQKTLLINNY